VIEVVIFKNIDKNGQTTSAREIPQNKLTSECWLVQMNGLQECDRCDFADTDDCGGKQIRETNKNEKGHTVPLGDELEW
jgi:hypothetical protein